MNINTKAHVRIFYIKKKAVAVHLIEWFACVNTTGLICDCIQRNICVISNPTMLYDRQ